MTTHPVALVERMSVEQRREWRVREDQCDVLLSQRSRHDSACLMPLPCPQHGDRPDVPSPRVTETQAARGNRFGDALTLLDAAQVEADMGALTAMLHQQFSDCIEDPDSRDCEVEAGAAAEGILRSPWFAARLGGAQAAALRGAVAAWERQFPAHVTPNAAQEQLLAWLLDVAAHLDVGVGLLNQPAVTHGGALDG